MEIKNRISVNFFKKMFLGLCLSAAFSACFLMPGRGKTLSFLKEMPEDKIQEIILEPTEYKSLISEKIIITDKKDIGEISAEIRKAESFFFNHPSSVWTVTLRIVSVEKDEFGGSVLSAKEESQGVSLSVKSGIYDGFMYDRLKNNGLGTVLEKMAKKYGGNGD